jgi:Flp pilus assembly protein TadB
VPEQQETEVAVSGAGQRRSGLARDITLYTLARVGLLVAIAGVLALLHVPLLVALAVSVVVSMPLAMLVLLRRLRARVAEGLAERARERKAQRELLRAQLRGDRGTEDAEAH